MGDRLEFPLFHEFYDRLKGIRIVSSVLPMIDRQKEQYGDAYLSLAEEVLGVGAAMGWDAIGIFSRYMIDALREQAHFLKHNKYRRDSFEDVRRKVYDNRNVMLDSYMPGAFLASSIIPILFKRYVFFVNNVIPHMGPQESIFEIGFGYGFHLWVVRKLGRGGMLRGIDISPYALEFTNSLFEKTGLSDKEKVRLELGDVIAGVSQPDASHDFILLPEVVEHLPDPMAAVREARRLVKKDGRMFFSTAYDSPHMDHITNFRNPGEVEALLRDGGFDILDSMRYAIAEEFETLDRSVGLAYFCVAT